ncbi:methyltransferase domain protein [delta proteobacterium NaphS2]|nr:methyltransferase domain protein [delta proteobacterium NaphS2]
MFTNRFTSDLFGGKLPACCKMQLLRFHVFEPPPSYNSDEDNDEAYYSQYIDAKAAQNALFNHRFNEFLSDSTQGKVLDIGCATGNFLHVAEQKGWEAVGIDLSPWVCRHLQEKGFTNVFNTTLEDAGFPDAYFDAVHLSHILEHVPKPIEFLMEIHRILKPKGRVIIEVPNESKFPWNYKIINLLQPSHAPRVKMTEKHLSLFTPRTLAQMLLKGGLNPKVVRSEGFGSEGRMQTPMFQKKTVKLFILRLVLSLNIDVRIGFGRYIVAMAEK